MFTVIGIKFTIKKTESSPPLPGEGVGYFCPGFHLICSGSTISALTAAAAEEDDEEEAIFGQSKFVNTSRNKLKTE